jgi:hypothetical protein
MTVLARPFWQRQFDAEPSRWQVAFDLAAGILLPLVCLAADPIVFRDPHMSPLLVSPLLGRYLLLCYAAIGTSLLALALWLLCRRPAALLAGFLVAGALFALLLGVLLLPFSLIGMIAMGFGALGLSPFLTAFVFWRNGVRAWARANRGEAGAAMLAACGFLAAAAGPPLAQFAVDRELTRAMELALSADPAEAAQGLARLRRCRLVAEWDRLVWAYQAEGDTERRTRLAEVYQEFTGWNIERRLEALRAPERWTLGPIGSLCGPTGTRFGPSSFRTQANRLPAAHWSR